MAVNAPKKIDPYLAWAKATNFRDYAVDADKPISVIAQTSKKLEDLIFSDGTKPDIIPLYSLLAPSRYFTAKFHYKFIDEFAAQVERFELGSAIASDPTKRTDDSYWMVEINKPAKLVLGVIDDFVGFGHYAHRSHGTRVWSQGHTMPQPASLINEWKSCGSMGYGYELVRTEPNPSKRVLSLDSSCYPNVLSAYTHGSHVSGLMRGLDAASLSAEMIAVHLPKSVLRDTTGGAMAVQVLDGIRYILAHSKPNDHIIINVSYGTYAGPHDGTSLLELAMDELIKEYQGRLQIVFPSGNQYEALCYSRMLLGEPGRKTERLRWKVLPDDRTPSFLELWLKPQDAKHLSIQLISPSGKTVSAKVSQGKNWFAGNPSNHNAAIIFPKKTAMSAVSEGALVALSPTASTSGQGVFSEHGVWEVMLSSDSPIAVDVYVERDDTFGRPARGRQSYFVDELYEKRLERPGQCADLPGDRIRRYGSLNTVVTGDNVVSVGAYVKQEKRPSWYSAAAASRVGGLPKPLIVAPGDDSLVRKGIQSAGTFGRSMFRMSGTSVATPQVSHQMAKAMNQALANQAVASEMKVSAQPNKVRSMTDSAYVETDPRISLPQIL